MKYEMIFGDEALFDGAPEYATHATKGGGFYFIDTGVVKFISNIGFGAKDVCELTGYLVAERRIIKEPKCWTWEDKKAGRLPEVGSRVDFCHKLNTNWRTGEIKYIDNQVAVIKADNIDRPFVYEFDRVEFKPIETLAEKAKREENEFVVAMLDAASQEQLMSAGFKSGVIAAYRKLKGGE